MSAEKTPTDMDVRAEFEIGVAAGLDPANEEAITKGGLTWTTARSFWFHRNCRICGHTFRVRDRVFVEGAEVVHAGRGLNCRSEHAPSASEEDASVGEFFDGLLTAWPSADGLLLKRLGVDDALVAPPTGGFRRKSCFVCSHTFRPNDIVVVCPCSPSAPRCQIAVHRDPIRGLPCYDEWNPGGAPRSHCPVTLRPLNREEG